jgi:hypothetical protein
MRADSLFAPAIQCSLLAQVKGKPVARRGRKASGLRSEFDREIAGLPAPKRPDWPLRHRHPAFCRIT